LPAAGRTGGLPKQNIGAREQRKIGGLRGISWLARVSSTQVDLWAGEIVEPRRPHGGLASQLATALVAYPNKTMARDSKEIRLAAHDFCVGSRVLPIQPVGQRDRRFQPHPSAVSPSMCLSWCAKMITRAKRVTFLGFDIVDCLLLAVGIALSGLLLLLTYDPTPTMGYSAPSAILEPAGTANPPVPLQKDGRISL
jgi:hypothetical protein